MPNNATAPSLYLGYFAFAGRTALAKSYLCSLIFGVHSHLICGAANFYREDLYILVKGYRE